MPIYFRSTPVNEPFTFSSIGCSWFQESVSRPKGYPLHHFLQTEQGCGRIIIQGKKYLLNPGEGLLIAPHIRHSYAAETEEWRTCFATFTGSMDGSIARMLGSRPVIFTEKNQGAPISALISDVIRQFEHPPIDTKALSVSCYALLMNFVDGVYTREITGDPLYRKYVAPVMKEIETRYSEELTVRELSRQVYVSPQYLSRLFGRFLGCPTYEYLTTYRISKAKEFLMTSPRSEVQEIAHKTGFPDASHFIAVFKKVTGMTPLEFRKLN